MSLGLSAQYQINDLNGNPYVGAKWYIYDVGTTDEKDIWLNNDFTGAAANPVTSDANGFFPAFYVDGEYKSVIENAAGVELISDDNILAATVADASTTAKGIVQFGLPSDVANQTAGLALDLKDIPSMAIDASQLSGTLLVSVIPNLDAAKITTGTFDPDRIPQATETALGGGELATQAELDAGTAGKLVDAALLLANSSDFTTDTNYIELNGSSKIVVQWGTSSITGNGSTSVGLPVTMANTSYVVMTSYNVATNDAEEASSSSGRTTNSFTLWSGWSSGTSIHWVVVGVGA